MIHRNNDPSQGYYVINLVHGGIVFHEPSQKIKIARNGTPLEREATEEDFASAPDSILIHAGRKAAPPDAPPAPPMAVGLQVKIEGTVG